MIKKNILIYLLLAVVAQAFSAAPVKVVTTQPLMWTRITNNLIIDSHWYVFFEADNRIFLSPVKEAQMLTRAMARYVINKNVETGLGIVGSFNFPGDPHANVSLMIPEVRGCVDLTFRQGFGKILALHHRNVIENRFVRNASSTELQAGYWYSFRYRYRVQAEFLLWRQKQQAARFILSDEIMVQAGKTIIYNVFDQNRVYAALNYEPTKWLAFEAGYLHIYQQRNSGRDFFNRHILRFTLYTKIFLPHKK